MDDAFERANGLLNKARQAVEKAIKAVLMWHSVRYPFTHDIAALLKLLRLAGLLLPPDADNLPYLTPFAALSSYEDENWGLPPSADVSLLLSSAEKTVAWASSAIKP